MHSAELMINCDLSGGTDCQKLLERSFRHLQELFEGKRRKRKTEICLLTAPKSAVRQDFMSLDIRTGESSWGPLPHELSPYKVTFGRQRLGSWSLSAPASTDMSVESLRLAVYQSSVRGCFSGNARQIPQQKFSFPFFKRGRGAGAEPLVPHRQIKI